MKTTNTSSIVTPVSTIALENVVGGWHHHGGFSYGFSYGYAAPAPVAYAPAPVAYAPAPVAYAAVPAVAVRMRYRF